MDNGRQKHEIEFAAERIAGIVHRIASDDGRARSHCLGESAPGLPQADLMHETRHVVRIPFHQEAKGERRIAEFLLLFPEKPGGTERIHQPVGAIPRLNNRQLRDPGYQALSRQDSYRR